MLLNKNINNLSGGVSQQPPESRFDNQVDEMNNCQITVSQGLRRRNPINFVGTTSSTNNGNGNQNGNFYGNNGNGFDHSDNMTTHAYDRGDGEEKYGMIVDENGIRVFDVEGNQKSVGIVGTDPFDIWDTSVIDFKKDIQFLTVGDTTWILNKKVTTAMKSDLTPSGSTVTAFYWIKRSFDSSAEELDESGYTYKVIINGVEKSANNQDSATAASDLATQIATISGFTAKASGSVIRIARTDGADFTFAYGDSWGDQASLGWKDSVAKLADLPSAMEGFTSEEVGTISITGTDRDSFVSYYLKWNGAVWVETVGEGLEYILDERTMPIKLVRQQTGSTYDFVVGFNIEDNTVDGFASTWENRTKGDDDSNPIPSFIGNKLSNMFFFKNRLGFTSEENVILSETGYYYNFFATTAMEILDSDPIDAAIDSNTVSIIRNVNPTTGAITLWADNGQFVLSGGDILSPATTRISQTSSYASFNGLKPVVLDNEIVFFNKKENNLDVLTYSPAALDTDKSTAESIAAHIPTYIPSTIGDVVVAPAFNMLFMLDAGTEKDVYVYNYYIRANQRVISSWSKWEFSFNIHSLNIVGDRLFLLGGTNSIYNLALQPQNIDQEFLDNIDDTTQVSYESKVVMSRFNIQTKQETQNIRDPFFIKNIVTSVAGDVDCNVINKERDTVKTINSKFVKRKLFIGGNSDKINIGFSSNYSTGFEIDTLSLEGVTSPQSRNI